MTACKRSLGMFAGQTLGTACPDCDHANIMHTGAGGCALCDLPKRVAVTLIRRKARR